MKTRVSYITFSALCLLGAGVTIYRLLPHEPAYHGKHLSQWLPDLDSSKPFKTREQARIAIKEIGVEGIPTIVRVLHRRDFKLWQKIVKEVGDPLTYTSASEYKERALIAIETLGPLAKDAMPELVTLLQNGELPSDVIAVMIRIDPQGAVQPIIQALSSTNDKVRANAAWGLYLDATNAETAIPKLVEIVNQTNSDSNLRDDAARALGSIHKQPNTVVPALINCLTDTNRAYRNTILFALRDFGTNAKSSSTAIERCLEDTNIPHRAIAIVALRAVDPVAAARAGFSTSDILKMAQNTNEEQRRMALLVLWYSRDEMRDNADIEVPALIPCLNDTNIGNRRMAGIILGDLRQAARPALPALVRALDYEDPEDSFKPAISNAIRRID